MSDHTSDIESYFDNLEKQLVDDGEEEMIECPETEEDCIDGGDDVDNNNDNDNDDDDGNDGENEEVVEDFLNDDDIDDDELEDGTIFMDAQGNYYYQSGKKAVRVKPVQPVKKKRSLRIAQKSLPSPKKKKTPPSPKPPTKPKEKQPNSLLTELKPTSPIKSSPKPGPAYTKKRPPKKPVTSTNDTKSEIKLNTEIKVEKSHTAGIISCIEIEPVSKVEKLDISPSKTNSNETITSDISNIEGIYEFDETEKNIDDPDDPDYTVDTLQINDSDYVVETEAIIKPVISIKPDASGKYQCSTCMYSTDKKFLLSRHLKTHSEARPYKCSVCERGFKTNISLVNHINTHLGNKPHQCTDCDMAFTTSGELTRHRRYRHTNIKPHKCTECDYASVELSKLRRHMCCHTGERPYQCPHCTYASPDTFKLKRHMRIHTGEKPYECDICHSRFTQSNSLKYHRLIHSVNDKPVFQCSLCPTTCGRKTDLRLHIQKQHNTENPLTCKRCGKVLPDRYSYKMHVKTHEGEKCYRCQICTYASISQRHLESHMLIHTDSKPFCCELCDQCFRQKQLLNRHMKVYHTENYTPPPPKKKAHRCPHCERSFAFKGNLIRHMEAHDPNSQHYELKLKLQMGRMKRLQPDGTIVTKVKAPFADPDKEKIDEEEIEDDDESLNGDREEFIDDNDDSIEYMYEEYVGEDDEEMITDEKQDITLKVEKNPMSPNQHKIIEDFTVSYKTETVKREHEETGFLEVQVDDDQGYMVIEVVPDEDEEERTTMFIEEEKPRLHQTVVKKSTVPKALTDITTDCFGFDDDAEADEVEDDAAHELIQILTGE